MTKNGTVESEEASTLTVDDISDDDIDLDTSYVVVRSEDGTSYNLPLSQLEEMIGPTITILN